MGCGGEVVPGVGAFHCGGEDEAVISPEVALEAEVAAPIGAVGY